MIEIVTENEQGDQVREYFANWATFGGLMRFFCKVEIVQGNGNILGYFLLNKDFF